MVTMDVSTVPPATACWAPWSRVALDALGGHGAGVPRVFRIHGRKREKPTYIYIYILWNTMKYTYIYICLYYEISWGQWKPTISLPAMTKHSPKTAWAKGFPHRMATEVLRFLTCTKNSPMVLGLGCPNFDPNSVVLGHPGWHTHIYICIFHYIHYIIYYMCIYIYIWRVYIYISWILNLIQELLSRPWIVNLESKTPLVCKPLQTLVLDYLLSTIYISTCIDYGTPWDMTWQFVYM